MNYKNNIIILFLSLLVHSNLWSQGNTPCTAAVITANTTCVNTAGTTVGATFANDGFGAPTCGSSGSPDVWYRFTATVSGSHTFTTDVGTITDGVMQLYSATACTPTGLVSIACDDDSGPGSMSMITSNLTAGTVYYIRVWNYGASGTGTFQICITAPPAPPANSTCATATSLPCGTTNLAGTTVGTAAVAHGTGCTMSNNGVWYSFVGNGQNTTITVSGGTLDAEMAITSGTCATQTNVTCQDVGGAGGTETFTFLATNGVTYFVYVAHYAVGTTTGTFNISRSCVAPPVPPANATCATATSLPCATANLAGTTVNTSSIVHGTGCTMSNYGVWYTFVGNGQNTTITVSGGTLDAEMAIVSGSCGTFTNITCQDAGGTGGTETYNFTATNGVTYYVYVADYSTAGTTTGTFTISRTCTAPLVNDEPCTATAIVAGATCSYATYTNAGATNSSLTVGVTLPTCASYNGADVWFTVTVPASGHLIFDMNTGVMTDGDMEIYRGTCGALTAIDCDDLSSANGVMAMIDQNTLIPGETIWIRVWEYGGDNNGTFGLCVYDGGGGGGGPCAGGAGGADCPDMQPVCTGITYCYTAGIGSTASGGNNYGCLLTQPNPSWYYFEISTAGNLVFDLAATSDIDFAVWGPYANAAAANAACGGLPAPIDCSYSISPTEQVNIAGAAVGQVYVLVITNYAGVVQDISMAAAGGNTAATNCAIVNPTPCDADAGNW